MVTLKVMTVVQKNVPLNQVSSAKMKVEWQRVSDVTISVRRVRMSMTTAHHVMRTTMSWMRATTTSSSVMPELTYQTPHLKSLLHSF